MSTPAENPKNSFASGIMASLAAMYQSPNDDWDKPFEMPQTFLSTEEKPIKIFTSSSRCGGFTLCWGAFYNADKFAEQFPGLNLADEDQDEAEKQLRAVKDVRAAKFRDVNEDEEEEDADAKAAADPIPKHNLDLREDWEYTIGILRARMNLPDWVEMYALPCCWPSNTDLDVFIGFTIRSFQWVDRKKNPNVDPYDLEITKYIRYTYEQASTWTECLFLDSYDSISHWARPLTEQYVGRIDAIKRLLGTAGAAGTFVMLPSDCASCS